MRQLLLLSMNSEERGGLHVATASRAYHVLDTMLDVRGEEGYSSSIQYSTSVNWVGAKVWLCSSRTK